MDGTGSVEQIITLEALVYGGDALGRLPDGRAIFVPFALPGEKVRLRIVEQKRGYARGELLEVLEPSPQRTAPRCAHFGLCGGCHYQHLPYEAQLQAKTAIVREQLERLGGLVNVPVQPVVPSPDPFNFRNHIQFHLTQEGRLGYHRGQGEQAFAIQECHLPEPALNALWPQLDFEFIPDLERIGLRLGADGEIQLILESRDLQAPELVVEELPVSVVHLSPAGPLVLAGGASVVMEVLNRPFHVSAGSFFQVNTRVTEKMVAHLLQYLPEYQPLSNRTLLLDVYCGVGLFSAFLAGQVGRLVGIEASPSAADDFVVNLDEFDNIELYQAPAELALPALGLQPDVILVDPPRAGLERRAMDGLLALSAPLLVYISCDLATLGRDARRLIQGGYRLAQVTPFDLFPQTYHIETISFWHR
ncbi:MAG: class I SAM-dependent RNA methyltransferase [Anaerolineales bacterium]|nr:class I SAM-dependent RNA methyltransferase [Anaerolineales bacterium]